MKLGVFVISSITEKEPEDGTVWEGEMTSVGHNTVQSTLAKQLM